MSNPGPVKPDVLSLRGLSKSFGAVQALRDVSIDCHAGEILALVGENGSREIDIAWNRERLPRAGRGHRRDRRKAPRAPFAGCGPPARARHRLPGLLARPRATRCREPLPRGAGSARPAYGQMQSWAEETLASLNLEFSVGRADRLTPTGGATAPRGRKIAADAAEGAPAGRAHDGARPARTSSGSTPSCSSRCNRASASSTSAIAFPRCWRSQTGSPFCGTAPGRGRSTRRRSPRTISSR